MSFDRTKLNELSSHSEPGQFNELGSIQTWNCLFSFYFFYLYNFFVSYIKGRKELSILWINKLLSSFYRYFFEIRYFFSDFYQDSVKVSCQNTLTIGWLCGMLWKVCIKLTEDWRWEFGNILW
jgi:hypothetical protein